MCTISTETIIRANRKTMSREGGLDLTGIDKDGFTVSVRYGGRDYSKKLSYDEIRESYGRALKSVGVE